ncbi:hypothetical protein Pmani_008714 [Petrolisthes manimaculis]|uniref:Cytochrome P450 n=1 Tax=Petrolisthes manimaculis TaxID=1843537 RepID=A0AAE1UIM0_9EUCA|nr:hypothetical protein Pmani_008714 [Petrolisthes manimaculis]
MVTLVLLLLLLVPLYFFFKKPAGLPPGPWGLPVVGKLPDTTVDICTQVNRLRKTHGDIILWRMGSRLHLFLCEYNVIKEALARLEFTDRPDYHTYNAFAEEGIRGILSGNGLPWRNIRRSSLRHLRDLGMGKTRLEESIHYEAKCLVKELRKTTDKVQPLSMCVVLAVYNVVNKMVADKRYEMDDPKGLEFVDKILTVNQKLQGPVFFFNVFPILVTLAPSFLKKKLGLYDLEEAAKFINDATSETVQEHKAKLDPSKPRDLIDHLLIDHQENDQDPSDNNEKLSIQATITELFLAGTETTSTTMKWSILYFIKHPDVQHKLHEEIDSVFPKGTLPYYHERNKLPYLEATMHEIHRIATMAPMAAAHVSSQDTYFHGYSIPKGTIIVPFLECCHNNPLVWENPDQFNPGRFLNPDGTFNTRREGFIAFGTGRRACVGENIARVEVFVLLVALLQNFTFTKVPGEVLSTEKDPKDIIINVPKQYNVIITERQ